MGIGSQLGAVAKAGGGKMVEAYGAAVAKVGKSVAEKIKDKSNNSVVRAVSDEFGKGFEPPKGATGKLLSKIDTAVYGAATAVSAAEALPLNPLSYVPFVNGIFSSTMIAVVGATKYGAGVAIRDEDVRKSGTLMMATAVSAAVGSAVPIVGGIARTGVFANATAVSARNYRAG